jgi:hypothetical protein
MIAQRNRPREGAKQFLRQLCLELPFYECNHGIPFVRIEQLIDVAVAPFASNRETRGISQLAVFLFSVVNPDAPA